MKKENSYMASKLILRSCLVLSLYVYWLTFFNLLILTHFSQKYVFLLERSDVKYVLVLLCFCWICFLFVLFFFFQINSLVAAQLKEIRVNRNTDIHVFRPISSAYVIKLRLETPLCCVKNIQCLYNYSYILHKSEF